MTINPIKPDDILEIYVDGASRGNPGPAAWSYIFVKDSQTIYQKSGYIGNATNNTAEYNAIINALHEAEKFTRWHVKVYSDSQLAIRQINKEYRIKKAHLSELCNKIYNQRRKFEKVKFLHIPRNNPFIQDCDSLCNSCLDDKGF